MQKQKGSLKVCKQGHEYYKSSDCPTCPICEAERKPANGLLSALAAPARRALERQNIFTVNDLTKYSEREILNLHGMGPGSIGKLNQILKESNKTFRKD